MYALIQICTYWKYTSTTKKTKFYRADRRRWTALAILCSVRKLWGAHLPALDYDVIQKLALGQKLVLDQNGNSQ